MPDFAMPTSVRSPAHAHLAAAVQDLANNLPASLLATLRFARRGTARFVTIDTTAELMHIESDLWRGRTSEHVIAVGRVETHTSRRADW